MTVLQVLQQTLLRVKEHPNKYTFEAIDEIAQGDEELARTAYNCFVGYVQCNNGTVNHEGRLDALEMAVQQLDKGISDD